MNKMIELHDYVDISLHLIILRKDTLFVFVFGSKYLLYDARIECRYV